ncbi:MAG TPA: chorismate mutase [Candidatus Stackebrandtia faecavium]|nr:chorismate mutase [Candidatus Stackebrandtia faecavium]
MATTAPDVRAVGRAELPQTYRLGHQARGLFCARADPSPKKPRTEHTMTTETTIEPTPAGDLTELRDRINTIDDAIIELWRERSQVSKQVGKMRMDAGGTRLALERERQICERFSTALGEDGTALAMLLLRAGRGKL